MNDIKKTIKSILYLGNDDVLYGRIEDYYSSKSKNESNIALAIKKFSPNELDFENKFYEQWTATCFPHILFIDFDLISNSQLNIEHLVMLLLMIKKNSLFKSTIFVGVFENKEKLLEFDYIFSYGINYTYLKNNLETVVFDDINYMVFKGPMISPQYAMAIGLNTLGEIYSLASIAALSADNIFLEHDLSLSQKQQIYLKLNFLNNVRIKHFEVQQTIPNICTNDHLNITTLSFPYPSPWDEINENDLTKDTVETWINLKKDEFLPKKITILVIDGQPDNLYAIYRLKTECDFNIEYRNILTDILSSNPLDLIETIKPSLIIFNLDTDLNHKNENIHYLSGKKPEDKVNDIDSLSQVIKAIKFTDIMPLILAFNSPSTTAAMQKTYEYPQVMSYQKNADYQIVKKLLDIYKIKNPIKIQNETQIKYSFKNSDLRKLAEIKIEIHVTTLTEHEVTFLSDIEIPYYSLLKMYKPRNLYFTIIPANRELKYFPNKHHYMAFIHGANEKDLNCLRMLVNQLCVQPIEKLDYIDISSSFPISNRDSSSNNSKNNTEKTLNMHERKSIDIGNKKSKL